mmetsp:Transcript_26430/g.63420  ORF Transcript_26430/g.63420 Transcript_26430/m.63420 type:complete len:199 (+) Transcript_26430:2-598(+)
MTISWDTLAMDVSIISQNRRYVLRILFDALDTCRSSLDCIKSQLKQMKRSQQHQHHNRRSKNIGATKATREDEMAKQELEATKRKYNLATKKMEYLLSWSSSIWSAELGQELSDEVRVFVADWSSSEGEDTIRVEGESTVERLIRGIHEGDGDDNVDSNGLLLASDSILNLGGGSQLLPLVMEEQMVSVSTVHKKKNR